MIAATPPMGWNSWDCYGAAVDEQTVRQNADVMAKRLKPLGWEYVVVDIQWYQPTAANHRYVSFADLTMDGYGRLYPAENRFPSAAGGKGFQPLADYVHSLGLKFGIHIMRGLPRATAHKKLPVLGSQFTCADAADPHSICAWNPDMYGVRAATPQGRAYYQSLFALYASWGVDFVKLDDIARELPRCLEELELISDACCACGREMVLSLSPGPAPLLYAEQLKQTSNMWRITDDFWDDWALLKAMFERAAAWCVYAGPGHWPDADMLPLGAIRQCDSPDHRTRFTNAEQVTMMTLWCVMRSPLMMGGDLTKCDDFTLGLLTNAEVLELLSASHCARPLYTTPEKAAWTALRKDGTGLYLALFNLSDEENVLSQRIDALECGTVQSVKELWTGETMDAADALRAVLPAHGSKLYFLCTRQLTQMSISPDAVCIDITHAEETRMIYAWIEQLVRYGIDKELIPAGDAAYTRNRLLEALALPGDTLAETEAAPLPLPELLAALTGDAAARGLIADTQGSRDLFDTRLMGALTPPPSAVAERFQKEYQASPAQAADWFYAFSRDVNYIRADRIQKDIRWQSETEYGPLDITINMSKPEKDPRDIAAAKTLPQGGYPRCLLCAETEGYAGRADFPARQNHRILPLTLRGEAWGFQYSPYVYYHQHCIVLNQRHVPMVIEPRTFDLLLDFLRQFPHFVIGSNADLPIVGGSILSHEHFQGGNYSFPMASAPVEHSFSMRGFPGVSAAIVRWPLSVVRLRAKNPETLSAAAARILSVWRGYSDESVGILAQSDGEPHNTVTPIARIRDGQYELDAVLRNNRTSREHPLGIFHPHAQYHHIKKENIGLIEVMGLAILPARLYGELEAINRTIRESKPCTDPLHADWAEGLVKKYAADGRPLHQLGKAALDTVLRAEVGRVFCGVLEDCGVFKRDQAGQRAFRQFLSAIEA